MSYDDAMADAQELRTALLDHGVKSASIELQQGRGGSGWHARRWVGGMGHHIASRRSQGPTPGLNLVKVGRADLPGPLCNGYGGFDEIARIICMAWANHPGAGGPWAFPAGSVPTNNGRPYIFGWEFEGGIEIDDFTDSYRLFMARCGAATLQWLGQPVEAWIEHKTWAPTRKVDRLGYTLESARAEIRDAIPTEVPTMFLPLDQRQNRTQDVACLSSLMNTAYGLTLPVDGTWTVPLTTAITTHLGRTGSSKDGTFVTGQQWARLLVAVARSQAPAPGPVTGLQRGDTVTLA